MTMENVFFDGRWCLPRRDGIIYLGKKNAEQLKTGIVSLKPAETSLSNTFHTEPLIFGN